MVNGITITWTNVILSKFTSLEIKKFTSTKARHNLQGTPFRHFLDLLMGTSTTSLVKQLTYVTILQKAFPLTLNNAHIFSWPFYKTFTVYKRSKRTSLQHTDGVLVLPPLKKAFWCVRLQESNELHIMWQGAVKWLTETGNVQSEVYMVPYSHYSATDMIDLDNDILLE